MKERWSVLFESLLREIANCQFLSDPKVSIEFCFNVSLKYWSEIQMSSIVNNVERLAAAAFIVGQSMKKEERMDKTFVNKRKLKDHDTGKGF